VPLLSQQILGDRLTSIAEPTTIEPSLVGTSEVRRAFLPYLLG
jgi:hypothetical protein